MKKIRRWHRRLAIIFLLPIIITTVTGALLTQRNNLSWMSPKQSSVTPTSDFSNIAQVIEKMQKLGIDQDNISSIIYRPGNHQFFVRTKNYHEYHLHAQSLKLLHQGSRLTTLMILIHEGSILGRWGRDGLMFVSSLALLLICYTGGYLWIKPFILKTKKKKTFR